MKQKTTTSDYINKIKQLNESGYIQNYSSFSFYLYSLQLTKPEEEMIFFHIKALAVIQLQQEPDKNIFILNADTRKRLVSYDYHREEKYEPVEEREILQNLHLLKAKDILSFYDREGEIITYKFSEHFLRIVKEEKKLLFKMSGAEEDEYFDVSYLKILHYCMLKSSSRGYVTNDIEVNTGEFFAGKWKLVETLGVTVEEAQEGIQRALDLSFIKISKELEFYPKTKPVKYNIYHLSSRFHDNEDLYKVPFEGSFAEKNYLDNKPFDKDQLIDFLETSPNFLIKMNDSKELQRTVNRVILSGNVPQREELFDSMKKITEKLQEYTIKSLITAFKELIKIYEKKEFISYKEVYQKLFSLLKELKETEDKDKKITVKTASEELDDNIATFNDSTEDIF